MSVTGGGHTMHNMSKATNLADRWVRYRKSCRSHRRWSSTAARSALRWHRSRSGTVTWGLHNTQDSEEASPCMTGSAVSSNRALPPTVTPPPTVTIRVPLWALTLPPTVTPPPPVTFRIPLWALTLPPTVTPPPPSPSGFRCELWPCHPPSHSHYDMALLHWWW